jgi:hypothetical protein
MAAFVRFAGMEEAIVLTGSRISALTYFAFLAIVFCRSRTAHVAVKFALQ